MGLGLAMALPSVASAYDGYCYARQRDAQTNGTVIGAIAGAALGSNIAGRGDRTEGATFTRFWGVS